MVRRSRVAAAGAAPRDQDRRDAADGAGVRLPARGRAGRRRTSSRSSRPRSRSTRVVPGAVASISAAAGCWPPRDPDDLHGRRRRLLRRAGRADARGRAARRRGVGSRRVRGQHRATPTRSTRARPATCSALTACRSCAKGDAILICRDLRLPGGLPGAGRHLRARREDHPHRPERLRDRQEPPGRPGRGRRSEADAGGARRTRSRRLLDPPSRRPRAHAPTAALGREQGNARPRSASATTARCATRSRCTPSALHGGARRPLPAGRHHLRRGADLSPEVTRYLPPRVPGDYFLTRGGSLGVGIPGAHRRQAGPPGRTVIGFTGDGGQHVHHPGAVDGRAPRHRREVRDLQQRRATAAAAQHRPVLEGSRAAGEPVPGVVRPAATRTSSSTSSHGPWASAASGSRPATGIGPALDAALARRPPVPHRSRRPQRRPRRTSPGPSTPGQASRDRPLRPAGGRRPMISTTPLTEAEVKELGRMPGTTRSTSTRRSMRSSRWSRRRASSATGPRGRPSVWTSSRAGITR